MAEQERQAKTTPNGPVAIETLSNGTSSQPPPPPAEDERMADKDVAILEKKLEDLKVKNNVSSSLVLANALCYVYMVAGTA